MSSQQGVIKILDILAQMCLSALTPPRPKNLLNDHTPAPNYYSMRIYLDRGCRLNLIG